MTLRAAGLALALLFGLTAPLAAQGSDRAGEFDFYVLSLSWSPTYCAAAGPRADRIQCGGDRPYAFVVHGLWPQYERGSPQFCDVRADEPTRRDVDGMLDIMPSRRLARHQWRKHGACSGLDAAGFFARTREAREAVTIPEAYRAVERHLTTSPADLERAFIAANPGLEPSMIAVDCDRRNLREIRICMSKDLRFRRCAEVDRKACRADRVTLPPVRAQ